MLLNCFRPAFSWLFSCNSLICVLYCCSMASSRRLASYFYFLSCSFSSFFFYIIRFFYKVSISLLLNLKKNTFFWHIATSSKVVYFASDPPTPVSAWTKSPLSTTYKHSYLEQFFKFLVVFLSQVVSLLLSSLYLAAHFSIVSHVVAELSLFLLYLWACCSFQ